MPGGTLTNSGIAAGWHPRPLLSREIRFGTWIAFFAWVFAVYDFMLFGTLLPKLGVAVCYARDGVAVVGGHFPGDPHDPHDPHDPQATPAWRPTAQAPA